MNDIKIHHKTSIGVCHNLSFSGFLKSSIINLSSNNTWLKLKRISFIHLACFPDSNLTFIASYAINNENAKHTAKIKLSNHSLNQAMVVTLVANPEWKDGNHQAANIL